MLAELENVAEQMRDLRIQMECGVGGGGSSSEGIELVKRSFL